MQSRRTLLIGTSAVLALRTLPVLGAWRVIHGLRPHRVAANRAEAISKYLWLIDGMDYTSEALAYFRRTIPSEPGRRVEITHQRYAYMAFFDDKTRMRKDEPNVDLEATTRQFAERWTYTPTGESVDLPETCENFAKPYVGHHCFDFRLDFRGNSLKVGLWPKDVPVDHDAYWQRLLASDCFKVTFGGGATAKPERCLAICEEDEDFDAWPPGLPVERRDQPDLIFVVPAGIRRVISFPDWAAVHWATYCPINSKVWQGYVFPDITEGEIAQDRWEYPTVVDSDPEHR